MLAEPITAPAVADHAMRIAFTIWFALPPAAAAILVRLYNLRGEHMSAHHGLAGTQSTKASVAYHVHHLRQALNNEAIDYTPRQGYRLTDEGMAECRAVLWTMGEELRRAS